MNHKLGQSSILVIDDDELTRMACRKILSREGYHTIEAENGVTGLELYKKNKPPLVITDILMPDIEGLQTIRNIIDYGQPVRIIAISGGGSTQNMNFLKMATTMGADRALEKPVRPSELLGAVKTLLQQ